MPCEMEKYVTNIMYSASNVNIVIRTGRETEQCTTIKYAKAPRIGARMSDNIVNRDMRGPGVEHDCVMFGWSFM